MATANRMASQRPLAVSSRMASVYAEIIGTHADDGVLLGFPAIWDGFLDQNLSVRSVVVTDGAGAPQRANGGRVRSKNLLRLTRRLEEIKVGTLARYAGVTFLDYSSATVKDSASTEPTLALYDTLLQCVPAEVWTHSPLDEHESHRAVLERVVQAIQMLPFESRPKLRAGEVWCSHAGIAKPWKVRFDVSDGLWLARRLLRQYRSQLEARWYDRGAIARWIGNATFEESHEVQTAHAVVFALDLTRLIDKHPLTIPEYVREVVSSSFRYSNPISHPSHPSHNGAPRRAR